MVMGLLRNKITDLQKQLENRYCNIYNIDFQTLKLKN